MYLNELLILCNEEIVTYNHVVEGIIDESFLKIPNSIYVDLVDGRYIDEAVGNGARTIVTENVVQHRIDGINYIVTSNASILLAKLLYEFNKSKLSKIKFIGVIGTAAKTSTALLIHNFLISTSNSSMYIGSLGLYYKNNIIKHNNTTPKITDIYRYIDIAVENDITNIVIEVSSIGIDMNRVLMLPFYILVLTNVYEDHLDYHGSKEAYVYSKTIPFLLQDGGYQIINKDSEYYKEFIKHSRAKVCFYSIDSKSEVQAYDIYETIEHTCFKVMNTMISMRLLGKMNVYNILPLFIIRKIYNIPIEALVAFTYTIKPIEGRLNLYKINNKYVMIDYAHTIDEYKCLLEFVRKVFTGNVYAICGCGGNRDKKKRSEIGELLSNFNVDVTLTNDNPRYENPVSIINDINSKLEDKFPYILDRRLAILKTLDKLGENELLLIIGKGAEDYLDIEGRKYPYSDYGVLEEYRCKGI